jgi:hypothetical protein
MEDIFIISKEYIEIDEVLSKLSRIVNEMNANLIEYQYEIIITQENQGNLEQIEVAGLNKEYFKETMQNENFKKDYGCLLAIDFYSEQNMIIPFLKLLYRELPNILIYSEIGSALNSPIIFNEKHLNNFSGSDSYSFLSNPPQD